MRVLLLNQTFYPDVAATAQHAHDLGRHLVGQGHEVVVIASRSLYGQRGAALPRRETVDGIEVHRVGMSLFGKSTILARIIDFALFYLLAALKALMLRRVDVVVTFTTPPFIALVGWMLKVVKRSKFVYWVMDLYPDLPVACGVLKPGGLSTRFFEKLNRFCLRHADRSVVLGRCMEQRVVAKGVPADRISRINVWADHEEVRPVAREDNAYRAQWGLNEKFVVMYSGNFGIGHDAPTICEAMARLANREDIAFVFVGGGKRMAEVERFVKERGLGNAQFHPYQPREKLNVSLSLADVHLISLLDPVVGIMVPSKLYGILGAGRPSVFVGHADSEIARTLVENDAGLQVACGDVEGLAGAIAGLADDRARAASMGEHARAALVERYDRRHACEAWERLLLKLTNGEDAVAVATPAKSGDAA